MKRLLIDTNLLCLLVIGRAGVEWIPQHKRLDAFGADDFALVERVVTRFPSVVVTPHILTETSNILRYAHSALAALGTASLTDVIQRTQESSYPAIEVIKRPEFARLGIADAALLTLASADCVLLSDDLMLVLAAQAAGYSAINYNHLRDGGLGLDDLC